MSSPEAQPTTELTIADFAAEDALYFRSALRQLVDIGLGLAHELDDSSHPAASPTPENPQAEKPAPTLKLATMSVAERIIAFERISRAIRRTISLARSLDQPAPGPRTPPLPANCNTGPNSRATQKAAAEDRAALLRQVQDAIDLTRPRPYRDTDDIDADDTDRPDLTDLDDFDDIDDSLAHLSDAELIANICEDLGLTSIEELLPNQSGGPRLPGGPRLATDAGAPPDPSPRTNSRPSSGTSSGPSSGARRGPSGYPLRL